MKSQASAQCQEKIGRWPSLTVMGSLCLRNLIVWLRLQGMDQIRKFDGVLDEEYRHVVAD